MILPDQLIPVGKIIKTHGINGELSATLDSEVDPDSLRCIVLIMEGIPVPFFIEQWRTRGTEAVLMNLEEVDTEDKARLLTGKDIYVFRDDLPEREPDESGFYASDLIGWTLIADGAELGKIISFDDSTINILLIVENAGGKQFYIPVAEEFITSVDSENKTIEMNLPTGLLEI